MCLGHTRYTDKFITVPHFDEARRIVASWPEWKQKIGHSLFAGQETEMARQIKRYKQVFKSTVSPLCEIMEGDDGDLVLFPDHERLVQQATTAERERCIKEMVEPLMTALRTARADVAPNVFPKTIAKIDSVLATVEAKTRRTPMSEHIQRRQVMLEDAEGRNYIEDMVVAADHERLVQEATKADAAANEQIIQLQSAIRKQIEINDAQAKEIAKLQAERNEWSFRAQTAEKANSGYKIQQEYQTGVIKHDVKAIVTPPDEIAKFQRENETQEFNLQVAYSVQRELNNEIERRETDRLALQARIKELETAALLGLRRLEVIPTFTEDRRAIASLREALNPKKE